MDTNALVQGYKLQKQASQEMEKQALRVKRVKDEEEEEEGMPMWQKLLLGGSVGAAGLYGANQMGWLDKLKEMMSGGKKDYKTMQSKKEELPSYKNLNLLSLLDPSADNKAGELFGLGNGYPGGKSNAEIESEHQISDYQNAQTLSNLTKALDSTYNETLRHSNEIEGFLDSSPKTTEELMKKLIESPNKFKKLPVTYEDPNRGIKRILDIVTNPENAPSNLF